MIRYFAVIASTAVYLVAAPAARAEAIRFANADLHYSFTAPEGWVRMPDDVLKTRGDQGAAAERPPVAGFQKPAKTWFHVPAVVVDHLPANGERPRDMFDELSHDKQLFQAGGRVVYDDKRGLVMIEEKAAATDGGQIERLSVFKPGTKGVVHLDFYLPAGDMPIYGDPTVTGVLDSLRFEPGFELADLAPGESRPLGEDIKHVLRQSPRIPLMIGLGLALIVASMISARRKRNRA